MSGFKTIGELSGIIALGALCLSLAMSPLEFWIRFLILGGAALGSSIVFLMYDFMFVKPEVEEDVRDNGRRPKPEAADKGGNTHNELPEMQDTY